MEIERISLLQMPEELESTPAAKALREALLTGEHKPAVGSAEYQLLVAQWEDLVLAVEFGDWPAYCSVVTTDGKRCVVRWVHSNGDGTVVVCSLDSGLYMRVPIHHVHTEYGVPLMWVEFERLWE